MDWLQDHAEALGDYADSNVLKQYKTNADALKALVDTKRMASGMIKIPGENAGEDDIKAFTEKLTQVPGVYRIPDKDDADGLAAFRKQLGVPDDTDGYTAPDGMEIDEQRFEAIKKAAHGVGINNDQLTSLMKADARLQKEQQDAFHESQSQAEIALKREWGVDYERRVANAVGIARQMGGTDFDQFLEQFPEVQKSPAFLKVFEKISRDYVEDNGRIDSVSMEGKPTPDEAALELNEIRGNPKHPYNSAGMTPAKKAAMRKVIELQAYAEGKVPDPEAMAVLDNL